jgi:DNA-binding Lrp family transcriptional regulator
VTALQDNGTETVPLAEAAARLGISEELVRKRIYRGKLTGEKVDGRWHVVLNRQDAFQDSSQDQSGYVQDSQDTFVSELITHQQEEITFLRQELSARAEEMTRQREQWAEESRRKDVIIHELSTQLKALPERVVEQQQAAAVEPAPELPPKRSWWKFWAAD